jgi:hypothetical protein
VRHAHERVVLTWHGKPAVAMVSVEDLEAPEHFEDEGFKQVVNDGAGGTTNAERTAGVDALAQFHEQTRIPLSREVMIRYAALVNFGLYKPEELITLGATDDELFLARNSSSSVVINENWCATDGVR